MRTPLFDARDTLSSAIPSSSDFIQPSSLFTSPLPISAPTLTFFTLFTSPFPVSLPVQPSSFTPKIYRVRSVAPSTGVMTFTELLNFFRTRSLFLITFLDLPQL